MIRQAVIMAGGRGTRLRTVTNDEIPKPMVPVAGKPLLERQLETLRKQGVGSFVFITGHLGSVIREHFGDGKAFGVHIDYIEEKAPMGTAGALSLLTPFLQGEKFFLAFGDIIFDIDLARMENFHNEKGAFATLFVHPNAHPYDSDLVVCEKDGRVLRFDPKHNVRDYWYHNCVNAGLYVFDSTVCKEVPADTKYDLEKQLLAGLIGAGMPVYAYRSSEYVKDAGTEERLAGTEKDLRDGIVSGRSLQCSQRAIFLDRDGTLNRKNGLVSHEEQLELEACAAEAVREINASGYLAVVVTNQPVVARGLCSIEDVECIHRKLETLLGREGAFLDDIRFCPHHPDRGYPEENPAYKIPCLCRKPGVGMLEDAARDFCIDLSRSWMVGDSTVDIQTGRNAGMHTALVLTGDAGRDGKYAAEPDLTCGDLLDAVRKILEKG